MSTTSSKIEILVVEHKPSFVPKNELLKPIQVGAALAGKRLEDVTYYDDQGDNISELNAAYCELTATYWAWKNIDADYYGLFHYRRYLSFSPKQQENNYAGQAYPSVEASIPEIDLYEDRMRAIIEAHDLIIPRQDDTRTASSDKSLYEQYKNEHVIADLDFCIDYIKKNYPNIAPHTETLHTSLGYFCNMFVMKKELYNEYCAFMFDVLGAFDAHADISGYSVQQYRVNGFLAERLTDVFIHYLQAQKKYKIKELQMTYFENTEPVPVIHPVAKEDNIAVVLAANDFYVPYISTLIHSIAENASKQYTYDINIFHQDITPLNMNLLRNEFDSHPNVNIRFCDLSSKAHEYKNLFTKWHFTVETYFRLFIQDIMGNYKKVLYLDGDMIVKADIAELYNEDVEGYLLAAARDIDMAGVYNSNSVAADDVIDPKRKNYIDNELKIRDPYGYFQAGVILFNLEEMRKSFNPREAFTFAASRQWEYLDQDVLNYFAQGKVKYIDLSWNVLYDWEFVRIKNVISKAPISMYRDYMESRKNPKIIHYGGTIKPWQRPDTDYGDSYWRIARLSAYYELIINRMSVWAVKHASQYPQTDKPQLRARVVRKLRRTADKIAPKGTPLRAPITLTSRAIKKVLRK